MALHSNKKNQAYTHQKKHTQACIVPIVDVVIKRTRPSNQARARGINNQTKPTTPGPYYRRTYTYVVRKNAETHPVPSPYRRQTQTNTPRNTREDVPGTRVGKKKTK